MDKARNGELFWYRKELPNGHEDVVIDAATGKPTTGFDAAELARQVQAVYASETAPTDVLMAPDGGSRSETGGGICISTICARVGCSTVLRRVNGWCAISSMWMRLAGSSISRTAGGRAATRISLSVSRWFRRHGSQVVVSGSR